MWGRAWEQGYCQSETSTSAQRLYMYIIVMSRIIELQFCMSYTNSGSGTAACYAQIQCNMYWVSMLSVVTSICFCMLVPTQQSGIHMIICYRAQLTALEKQTCFST